jgi:hypothetical protein
MPELTLHEAGVTTAILIRANELLCERIGIALGHAEEVSISSLQLAWEECKETARREFSNG